MMLQLSKIKQVIAARKPQVILTMAVLVAFALVFSRPEKPLVEPPERSWNVEAVEANIDNLSPTLELFGTIRSPEDSRLSSALEAEVLEVKVFDGQTVEAGDLLVVLDGRDAELALAEKEADVADTSAQLRLARRTVERGRQALAREKELLTITESKTNRAQQLFSEQLLSESDIETSTETLKRQQLAVNQSELSLEEAEISIAQLGAQLARAEAQRDRARLDAERAKITAPFAGVISDLAVSKGDRIREGDELMRLQNPASIEVRTQIPSRYASSIRDGLNAGADIIARVELDGDLLPGQIARISGQTREGSGGVDSFIRLSEIPLGLRLGSTVRVLVELPAERSVIAVPAEAIYGRDRLYRVRDQRMEMVTVERIGERVRSDGTTDVIVRSTEINDQDQIVVTKLANAADGLLVNIMRDDTATAMPAKNEENGGSVAALNAAENEG